MAAPSHSASRCSVLESSTRMVLPRPLPQRSRAWESRRRGHGAAGPAAADAERRAADADTVGARAQPTGDPAAALDGRRRAGFRGGGGRRTRERRQEECAGERHAGGGRCSRERRQEEHAGGRHEAACRPTFF
ncbi:uncharacterized protein LOC120685645 [Panicum virgatum]|uniref:uncharacterized protein LOC120685645 n=1 Tax=Panicum virgatum TaxID=38727 RepID=UPI0019D6A8B3|nr:uncharacterized protein LOC120685645 [Panicum virgatum]